MEEKKTKAAPEKSQSPKGIHAKMAAIMRATRAIGKNSRNQQQGFNFRGIDDVMNEMHGVFADNGVFIIPEVVDFTRTEVLTSRGGKLLYTLATIKHHFVAEDGSEIVTTTVGEGMDSGDKGMNKAMSVALKYALLQMFLIPTKEEKDPDSQSYELAADSPATINPNPFTGDLVEAIAEVKAASDRAAINKVWSKWTSKIPSFAYDGSEFFKAVAARITELGVAKKTS